ncbi:MAG: C39 family peptidase [Chloroflexi bacterium]|nr:C39 family peptidase [Chloroflexota bacterium]
MSGHNLLDMRSVSLTLLLSGSLLVSCGGSAAPTVSSPNPSTPSAPSSSPSIAAPAVQSSDQVETAAAASSMAASSVAPGSVADSSASLSQSAAPESPAGAQQPISAQSSIAPTAGGVASASSSSSPSPSGTALPAAKRIGPLPFISQTLNNCGPASVAEDLSFWGIQRSQAQVAQVLRPDLPDYGMSLYGVPFYVESVGMRAYGMVGGTQQLIKAFIASGIPVIVADLVSSDERIRHFRPIDGYDDNGKFFIGSDPYLGANHKIGYTEFDELWKISNNRFSLIYPPDRQGLVDTILRDEWDRNAALQAGLKLTSERAATQPNLPWTWLEMADLQIENGDLKDAGPNIAKGAKLGVPYEAHWLQLKLQRATGAA